MNKNLHLQKKLTILLAAECESFHRCVVPPLISPPGTNLWPNDRGPTISTTNFPKRESFLPLVFKLKLETLARFDVKEEKKIKSSRDGEKSFSRIEKGNRKIILRPVDKLERKARSKGSIKFNIAPSPSAPRFTISIFELVSE